MRFVIPLVPPSNNHYKIPNWKQRRFFVTREAKAFKDALAVFCNHAVVPGKKFSVKLVVYLGKNDRLDADNASKVVIDGMQECGVFNGKSDASVKQLHVHIDRDSVNPRTVIEVEAI